MRPPIAVGLSLLALIGVLSLACGSAPVSELPPSGADDPVGATAFSADNAWRHLESLAAIGPRASGTPGAAEARAYLREELGELGLTVEERSFKISGHAEELAEELAELEMVNLSVTIPGDSPDLIVLAAPYDNAYKASFAYLGVNDGASGAAILLELARLLVAKPLPYTVRVYFLDGEAPLGRGGTEEAAETHLLGSLILAKTFESKQLLASIRLLIFVNRVSDADLRIARDRFSHRTHRDAIWRVAAELGYTDVFPPSAAFEAPVAGHRSFIDIGMRRAVAIVDPHFGSDELAGLADHSEEDTLDRSSRRSLEIVGDVLLASLETISARLVKIDAFAEAPLVAEPGAPTGNSDSAPAEEAKPPEETESPEDSGDSVGRGETSAP